MNYLTKSIRPFIGAKNYNESLKFYRELGFEEIPIPYQMTLFKVNDAVEFYLQDAYVKDWIDNSMIFLEVDDVDACWKDLKSRDLTTSYKNVRLSEIKEFEGGRECFLHDPSGILWHFGQFDQ